MDSDSFSTNKIDFSDRAFLKSIENELITPGQSWNDAKEEMLGFGMEYVSGQEHMIKVLKHLFSLNLSKEEMNKQLGLFLKERQDFIEFAWKNDPLSDVNPKL